MPGMNEARGRRFAPGGGRRRVRRRRRRGPTSGRPAARLRAAAAALLLQAPQAFAAACDPQVAAALAEAAQRGVERDVAIVRHPDQGIRNPESILEFSCAGEMFDYGKFDLFYNPGRAASDLLGLVRRQVCDAARRAYGRYVGRALDAAVYAAPRLPGLEARPRSPPEPRPAPGAGDRFRELIGGERR